jgi:hypothetical protein
MKIITCITDPEQIGYKYALQASCKFYGLDLITLTSTDNWKSHRERYTLYKELLVELDPDEPVFFTDGYDVIFVGGEEEILAKYKKLAPDNQILMSADRFCAPDPKMAKHFEQTKFGYNFLCAGGLIGKVKDILVVIDELFKGIENDKSSENKEFFWCDQYLWTKLYLTQKFNIISDHNCEIFQTFTSVKSIQNLYEFVNNEPEVSEDEDLYQRKSLTRTIDAILDEVELTSDFRIHNKTTNTYPIQIHFNTKINKLVMFMEPFIQLVDKLSDI